MILWVFWKILSLLQYYIYKNKKKWVIIKIYLWQKLYPKKTGKILLSVEISFDFRRKNDFPKIARRPLNSHDFRGDVTKKRGIVFHKEQRRTKGENELLYLRAGNDVDIIERFVPNIQVRAFAKASSECRFLFLARAHGRQIGGEILFSEPSLSRTALNRLSSIPYWRAYSPSEPERESVFCGT